MGLDWHLTSPSQLNEMHRSFGIRLPLRFAVCLGLYALAGGWLSFLGWAVDIPRLTDWDNHGISIQPDTALTTMLAACGLLFLASDRRVISAVCGGVVALVGGFVLFQSLTGIDISLGAVLPLDLMGLPGAISWTFIGIALAAASTRSPQVRRLGPMLALVTTAISGLSLVGYMYGAGSLYAIPTATVIAFQTSTFILAIAAGLILAIPESGPARLLIEDSPAGILMRRFLPAVLVLPVVLGVLRLAGQRHGLYDLEFGTAIRTIAEIALLLALLWLTTRAITRQTRRSEEAEQKVLESERRLRTVTEQAQVGLVIVSPSHRYLFANRAYLQAVASPWDCIVGRQISEVLPEAYETEVKPRLDRAFAGETVNYELSLPDRDRVVAVTYQPQPGSGGRIESVIVSVVDITDRKRTVTALQQTRAQLENDLAYSQLLQSVSSEIIHEHDDEALYEKILDAAVALMRAQFGSMQLLQRDDATGTSRLKLLAFRGFPAEAAKHWEWVDTDTACVCGLALRDRRRIVVTDVQSDERVDAEERAWYARVGMASVQSTLLLSRHGRVLGMISTQWKEPHAPSSHELGQLDILARLAADLFERRQSEDALRHADRRKDEFLALLAHELRNPLAPVRSAVDLMEGRLPPDGDLIWARGVIDRQVALMGRLLDDLLDVGRIAQDRLELKKERLDVRAVIQTAAEISRPLVAGFRHELRLVLPETPVFVEADSARLSQVFGNLLNNACRYTPAAGHLAVILEAADDQAVIRVRDNGIGLEPDELSSIFEMFFQVDQSLERSQSGLGIGLHLARRLVEMHGGTIEAHSRGRGHGSEFVVGLPLAQAEMESQPADPPGTQQDHAPIARRRILVVDDNVDAATSMAMLLGISGHDMHIAHDGNGALEAADQLRPDVILLDIGLPRLNGYEVCRRIRQQSWGEHMMIVAVTGWGQELDRRRSAEAGFNHHVVKPVDHGTILKLLAPQTELHLAPEIHT